MSDQIPLYFIGAIIIIGGFYLMKWGWDDKRAEDRNSTYDPNWSFDFDFRIGHLTVAAGFALMIFGGYCIFGASQGWNTEHVLKESFGFFTKNSNFIF